jgi:predicted TPR repeat methyltransferase
MSERELRNEFASHVAIGTHLATDQWFAEKLRGKRFGTAIDIACNTGYGYGIYGLPFADKCTFVDFADKCLEEARKRYTVNSNFICADLIVDWPFSGVYDLVCLVQFIQHIPDIKTAELVFGKAAMLVSNTMLFSHYGINKKITEGTFDCGLFYRRCPYEYLEKMILDNGLKIIHFEDILGDYNFVLEKV